MPDLLPTLGGLTLGGSAAILILALLSRTSRTRYGARWRCWAWLLLSLRLAVPFPLLPAGLDTARPPIQLPAPSDTVIYQYRPAPQEGAPGTPDPGPDQTPNGPSTPPPASSSQNGGQVRPAVPSQPEKAGFDLSLSKLALIVWIVGMVLMLLWALTAHLRFLLYLRRWSSPVTDFQVVGMFNELGDLLELDRRPRLLTCQGLSVPMLAGLVRPVLLLPADQLSQQSLRYSLLHELTHCRRRDIWLKALALWVNAVHWFNPLSWYMVRLVERDTELACDEAALRALPREEHAAYGRTILEAVGRLKSSTA